MKKSVQINYYISILVSLTLLFIRPTWFGEMYSLAAIIFLWFLFMVSYFATESLKLSKQLTAQNRNVIIPFIAYEIIYLLNSSIRGDELLAGKASSVLFDFLFLSPILYFLCKEEDNLRISKVFFFSILFASVSTVITAVLSIFISKNFLLIYTFLPQKSYAGSEITIFFPFTPMNNGLSIYGERFFGMLFHRSLNWFREPGVTIVFIAWAFITASKYLKKNSLIIARTLLAIAGLLSFSTTSIYIVPLCIFYTLFIETTERKNSKISSSSLFHLFSKSLKKILFGLSLSVLIIVFTSLVFNISLVKSIEGGVQDFLSGDNSFNLEHKNKYGAISLEDRVVQTDGSLANFAKDPFALTLEASPGEINVLASLDKIGIQGLLCIFIMYFFYVMKGKSVNERLSYLFSILPLVISCIFTQPLIVSPLTIVLLLFKYPCRS